MLNLDLSKAIPRGAHLYFSAFMPGLFLEFSILLANPALANQLALRTQEGFGFGRYLTLFVGLFLAFVIGNALMCFASLIQMSVGYAYTLYRLLRELFERHALLPVLTKLTHIQPSSATNATPRPGWIPPRWLSDLYVRTVTNVQGIRGNEERADYLWWEALARQLLLKRYGLNEEDLPAASFSTLQKALTTPTPEEIRGSILVNASHATGWAALIAPKFAPALQTKWYITFAVFLIAYGLLHDWYVAKRLWDPGIADTLRLQAVLREFPKIQPTAGAVRPENHADKGEAES